GGSYARTEDRSIVFESMDCYRERASILMMRQSCATVARASFDNISDLTWRDCRDLSLISPLRTYRFVGWVSRKAHCQPLQISIRKGDRFERWNREWRHKCQRIVEIWKLMVLPHLWNIEVGRRHGTKRSRLAVPAGHYNHLLNWP